MTLDFGVGIAVDATVRKRGERIYRELAATTQASFFPSYLESARSLVLSGTTGDQCISGRALAAALVTDYCRAVGGAVRPLRDYGITHLGPDATPAAATLDGGLTAADPCHAAHLIGAAYTAALPTEHRARHGIFYTPPALAAHLLDMAEVAGTDWRTARALDPACGGGAFLVAAAARMMAALGDMEPAMALRQIGQRLRGFELDPFGAWIAQSMLDIQLVDLARRAGRPVPKMVEVRDSLDLHSSDADRFDLVMGNPPYGRITLLPGRRMLYARCTYGHANLYGLFTDAALRWASPDGGLVAYVTPTSMLSGLYYKNLRSLLAREAPPLAVDLVAERSGVFDDVLQETMLAVYRRTSRQQGGQRGSIGFLSINVGGKAVARSAGEFVLPEDLEAPWLLPRSPEQVALTQHLRAMPHRLVDYGYKVSTGPLVWNRHKPQLQVAAEKGSYPVVWAESVSPDGRFSWRAEKRNHAPWFRARLPRDRWLLLDQPCVLLQRTTAKEQARRLIAAELPAAFLHAHGAAVVENHLNMVRPIRGTSDVPAAAIAALLNSSAADAAFRCINGSVAVSAFELEAMPVPSPAVMGDIARLLEGGATRAEIEAVIAAPYNGQAGGGVNAASA